MEAASGPVLDPASPGSSSVSASPFQYSDNSGTESVLNKSGDVCGDNSKNMIVEGAAVAEDEDYASGEEFVMALDNPVLDAVVGDVEGEKSTNDFDAVDAKEGEVGSFGGKGEFLDSVDALSVGSDKKEVGRNGRVADESVEVVGEEFEDDGGIRLFSESQESGLLNQGYGLSARKELVVKEAVDEMVGMRGEDNWEKGEAYDVQGELSERQEKVVSELAVEKVAERREDSQKNGEGEPQEKVVSEVVAEKVENEGEGGLSSIQEELSEPQEKVVSEVVVVKPAELQGAVNVLPTGDSVVDATQVDIDVVDPGVAVVQQLEENGYVMNEPEKDVPEVDVAKPLAVPLESGDNTDGEVCCMAGVYSESSELAGNSVVDAIQVDVVHTGVAVVRQTEDNGYVVNQPEKDVPEVDVVKPVAAPLESGDTAEGEVDNSTVGVYNESSEPAGQNAGDFVESQALQLELFPPGIEKDGVSAESTTKLDEIKVEDETDEIHLEDSISDGDSDVIFGGSNTAKRFIEELERASGGDYHTRDDSLLEQSHMVDGQIVTDSEGEDETDDAGDGKELFDSASLTALLKAATGADSGGGNITITSQDGSKLFTLERPAGLGSSLQSLRSAPRPNQTSLFSSMTRDVGGESEDNLSEEQKEKWEKLQQIRVKFLRLVHRLGLSPDESVAAQVLYRLALLGGRPGTRSFSLDAAKRTALELEEEENDGLDFSVNILVIGKSGVGKSATINSIFGEEKALIDAFETGTPSAKEFSGFINGVRVKVVDTPGLKSSVVEQGFNRRVLSSVRKFTKNNPFDVVLYVDRLDAQSRDLNDLPLLKTVTSVLGSSIWRNAIVTLTHAASAPPDGPSGTSLSYEVYVSQRSHVVQQSIGHAVGDLRMMSPSLMNPVSLVENHPNCRKNRDGQKILPNGHSWRPQLLLLFYAMKILSEAGSLSKPDAFDHRKLFGYRSRPPPLPYMLSSMLQSRPHPKLPSDQGGDNVDSDIDLDDLSDSDQDEEDEYDQLPPFKPLKKAQIAKLTREHRRAYYEEYDYRVKLLQKKQWKEELRRMREVKKNGKITGVEEEGADAEPAAPVAVPLPDMALPPSFDGDNPAYRYRFLEPVSGFLVRPVLDSHGWDHDCGYDGVNLEHTLGIANRFPMAYTIQITKDKKDFSISLDSSISAKHGDKISSMAGFDVQAVGKQLAYILRAETKFNNLKKNKAAGGVSFTFLGDNIIPGVKFEDQITLGKQYTLLASAGAVRSQHDTAYGTNLELQRRELDYPIGQVQSTLSMSIIKWRGDLALGFNGLTQLSVGRNSKVAVRAGINNKLSGQVTVRTSSSEHLSLALAAVIPTVLSIYRKLYPGNVNDKYSIY